MTPDADTAFAAALAHHEAGRLEEAQAGYDVALARDPDHVESLHLLGLITARRGDPARGVKMIRRAIGLAPGRAPHHNSLAFAYRIMGRDADAVSEYETAAALRPGSAEILNNLGSILRDLGRYKEAVTHYRLAAECAPGIAEIWYNLASTLADDDGAVDAEDCFRRAIELRPDFAAAIANYGRWLTGQARWSDAEAALSEATRLDPGDAQTCNNLGIAHQELGRTEAAAACYRRAIALDPGFTDAHYNLGCLLSGELRPDEALACHQAAVAADPLHGAARLASCIAWLPIIYRTEQEIADRRTGYLAALDGLAAAVEAPAVARAEELCEHFVHGIGSAAVWRGRVSGATPHVLLYPEIGMDPVCAALAARRLAPVQCVTWGHPETTGMQTMDYFLTADLMEPAGGNAHYTERMVRLPYLGLHYTPDEMTLDRLDRASLGLDPVASVYWSGQALYKYPPRNDSVFPRIAAAVGACQFVFIGFAKS
jgi:tetratricopeptide (TPR) repeat protein